MLRDASRPEHSQEDLVGADRVVGGQLETTASFVIRLLQDPGADVRVLSGQLGLDDEITVPGTPDGYELEVVEPREPGTVWAVDGGSCVVADGRSFQVVATRAARVRFAGGNTDIVENPPLGLRGVSQDLAEKIAREALRDLCGADMPEEVPELPRPVDALREWAEWGQVKRTVAEAEPGSLVLVDGSLHGGPLVPPVVVRKIHAEAVQQGVSLAGVVKASTLYWGRHAPLVPLLKRRADRELGKTRWSARISTNPVFRRLYIGNIFVAHLAPTAPYAFRVDVAEGPAPAVEVLGRLAGLAGDPAFVGYPYPLARAHQAARVTGYAVADVRRAFRDALGRQGLGEDDIEVLFQDFHDVLNRS